MKRYVKSSYTIEFHSVIKYDSYEDYCYAEMQGYFNETLTQEDYEAEFADFADAFTAKFGNLHKLQSVISAYIGFVPFGFIVVSNQLYHINYESGICFDKVDDNWLKTLGCITPLDTILKEVL